MKRMMLAIVLLVAMVVGTVAADLNPTPTWMTVYGTATFRGAALDKGDEVRAYTPEGFLVGCFTIEKAGTTDYGFMPIYGDDAYTKLKDGAVSGDAIKLVLYRVSDKKEYGITSGAGSVTWAANPDESRLDLMF